MKNVILYVRVSTDEQADKGYSLRDQEIKLLAYCKNNDLNVIQIFREDHSAKTFKRPEFKKLLEFCKKNKKSVNQLLFIKWDRFSRNTTESYRMLGVFDEMAIHVNAIEQPLDLSIPEQGLMLAIYLSMPEVENHRRSLNIRSGMRRAFKEGRYVGLAPKGYSNERDSSKKPIIVPNDDAIFIQRAFEMMATGLYNRNEIFYTLKSQGFKSSKTVFASILTNPIYYGGLYVKAYKDEVEVVVDGIHEPIITKSLFEKVQKVINGRKKKNGSSPRRFNEKFPLRGFINCPICNNQMTASISRGRNNYYGYYHCKSPCKGRYKLDDVEGWFNEFLIDLKLNDDIKELIIEMINEKLLGNTNNDKLGPKHYEKLNQIEERIIKLQDLFIDGGIDKKAYNEAKCRYEKIVDELKEKESNNFDKLQIFKIYQRGIEAIANLQKQYTNAGIEDKKKIIGSIFPKMFQFENKKVRTADINPLLLKITSINKALRDKKNRTNSIKMNKSYQVEKMGLEPTTS